MTDPTPDDATISDPGPHTPLDSPTANPDSPPRQEATGSPLAEDAMAVHPEANTATAGHTLYPNSSAQPSPAMAPVGTDAARPGTGGQDAAVGAGVHSASDAVVAPGPGRVAEPSDTPAAQAHTAAVAPQRANTSGEGHESDYRAGALNSPTTRAADAADSALTPPPLVGRTELSRPGSAGAVDAGARAGGQQPADPPGVTGNAGRGGGGSRRWSRTALIFAAGIAALIVLALISAAVGQVPTTPVEVAGSFFHRIGLDWGPMPAHPAGDVTLWEVRFPRVVMAILVGAALATAGALLQGVFANPLAEPGVIGVGAAVLMAAKLDLLALGESAARHLGVDVERLRRNVIVVVAVLATAGVAFTGIILFVGLIVPHLVRMLVGPAHRVLIPLSAILGAVVLLAADIGALALVHNADLPLGMLTSLVGGPFFFWLLRRTRARSGGWA